jgi:predicted lipoprotein with Yx(FWY)xxD motif
MKSVSLGTALLAALLAVPAFGADSAPLHKAGGMLVDPSGMTVYTFDKDSGGKSACNGMCANNWHPVKAPDGALAAPYSSITRDDGTRQLTYKGKPLYTFVKDKQAGDKTGDKAMEVWHVVID